MYNPDPDIEKIQILNSYRNLLRVWAKREKPVNKKLVRKAFNLAVDAHRDMRRKSGEPYIYHPLEVARIAAGELGLGTTSVICALLHDVVEDTEYSLEDIRVSFGDTVTRIIDGLTKIEEIFEHPSSSAQAENFRKMLMTLSVDVRVILIKLADRLHNMRTLDAMPRDKQLKIASETLYLFAPLAHRLGLHTIKSELEDLSLKFLEPEIYNTILRKLKESRPERKRFISKFIYPIKKDLAGKGMKFNIHDREKSVYSIWEKMRSKEIPFEDIFDLFAIRVIIDTPLDKEKEQCWRVYSVITDYYKPNQQRLRDWISLPKVNGYEALHTTVMSHSGKWVEVQIRTERMHEIAEKGYAAHWKYKEGNDRETGLDEWLNRIREMLQSHDASALDFVDDFKLNLFSDEIYVYTPKGELKNLPAKSTVLDFAYNIHSQVGNKSIGAKVNHNLVPLNHVLVSGDQVEVIVSQKQVPKENWLKFVITARAKHRINAALKERYKQYSEEGKEMLRNLLGQQKITFSEGIVQRIMEYLGYTSQNKMYYDFIQGDRGPKDVKAFAQLSDKGNWLRFISKPFSRSKTKSSVSPDIIQQLKKKPETLVLSDDIEDIRYVISKCCNPIPGDDVVGFMNRRGKILIHRTNCPVAIQSMSSHGNRIIKAKWKTDESIGFLSGIKIQGMDKKGMVKQIAEIISDKHDLGIRSFNLDTHNGLTDAVIMLYIENTEILNQLIDNLKKIPEIQKVSRIDRIKA
ncbi:MAG: RelA/SpoT family protein [Bacteroidales bacterium]|nr:RelA/SpoT family protein [Bacteroidales bacterium]